MCFESYQLHDTIKFLVLKLIFSFPYDYRMVIKRFQLLHYNQNLFVLLLPGGVEKHIRWKKVYGFSGRKYTVGDSSGRRYTIQVEKHLRFVA